MPKLEGVGFYDDETGISRADMEFLFKETEYGLCEREPKRARMSDPLVETSPQIENQELTARYLKTYFDNLVLSQLPEAATVDEFLENPLSTKPRTEFLSILFNDDDTILTHVVKNQNIKAVAALVKAGVDLNQFNRKGITPISAAAHKGNIDIMQLLIEGGALVNALNNSGSTALIQVRDFFKTRIRYVLLER